jgi:hypothetical protein
MHGMASGMCGGLPCSSFICWYVLPTTSLSMKYVFQVLGSSGGRIDLSPLRKNNGNWVTWPLSLGVQYHINVCGPLNPTRTHNCSGMKSVWLILNLIPD